MIEQFRIAPIRKNSIPCSNSLKAVSKPGFEGTALQLAEKLASEGGEGFNHRVRPEESTTALAADGNSPPMSLEINGLSAACLAVPLKSRKTVGFRIP